MTKYPSKRDTWITGCVLISSVSLILLSVWVLFVPLPAFYQILIAVICLVSALLGLWIVYGTYYYFNDEFLCARSGPFHYRVKLEKIVSVLPSGSVLTGPALSFDRLHVKHENSIFGILVSPLDKESFLSEILSKAPQLEESPKGLTKRVGSVSGDGPDNESP